MNFEIWKQNIIRLLSFSIQKCVQDEKMAVKRVISPSESDQQQLLLSAIKNNIPKYITHKSLVVVISYIKIISKEEILIVKVK